MKIIDLSIPIEDGLPSDPPIQIPKIQYCNHKDTAEQMAGFFKGCTVEDLPEGNGWGIEFLQVCTHSGTHVDAPYHYYPTMNGGERAWTIDEVPLDWFVGDGVVMDFHDKPDGYKITAKDVEEYLVAGAGMSYEATMWLLERGVRVVGTDGWSWDVPLPFEGEEFEKNHDASIIWEAHRVGRDKAYCHIEKLTNLDQLPVTGFKVNCFPVSIKAASAGWARVVAFVE